MYTQEIEIKEELTIVDQIVFMDGTMEDGESTLIPDNKSEIIIPLSGDISFKLIGSFRKLNLCEGQAYFLMPRGRGAEIDLEGSECLILKINPLYARRISQKLREVSNGVYRLDLEPLAFHELKSLGRCSDIYGTSEIIERACNEDFLEYNTTILDSIEMIKNSSGTISVKDIYTALNISKSKLEQHFNKELGLTPKEFCKIEKLNFFINTYLNEEDKSLTELTYLSGYYDQSHLIKDFNYFLDASPKRFFNTIHQSVKRAVKRVYSTI
ncbi:MAG: helix-turn-helix domain-containing protein [Ekhidna sp.]|uniref:helix-turn-helix domain-containing protein n=1 Tax=Ekhidna sp. TaxID=2608089 RepID=UPI0032EC4DAC